MNAIEISHLTKLYKNNRGIRDLSMQIKAGQVFGLLGPNGSGKTTTMKILSGLVHADSGDVKVFGHNPGIDTKQALEKVGCLIEAPSFYPYLTAEQNLELVRSLYPHVLKPRVAHILEQVGLSANAKEKAEKFSLGMKQRLGLAMTLLSEPDLIILDEPCNGLDIEGMADIRRIISQQASKGRTVLISSHLAAEIEHTCTQVAVIREGALISIDDVPELLTKYSSIEEYYLDLVSYGKEMAS